jgi:hypothetical protein
MVATSAPPGPRLLLKCAAFRLTPRRQLRPPRRSGWWESFGEAVRLALRSRSLARSSFWLREKWHLAIRFSPWTKTPGLDFAARPEPKSSHVPLTEVPALKTLRFDAAR